MQWRVGYFPQFHCVPGTAVRAREEGPSAWPPAGWRSNLQPETDADGAGENMSIHSSKPNGVHGTNQSGIFVPVQGGGGDSRQSQPLARRQGHTVTPGGSLGGVRIKLCDCSGVNSEVKTSSF